MPNFARYRRLVAAGRMNEGDVILRRQAHQTATRPRVEATDDQGPWQYQTLTGVQFVVGRSDSVATMNPDGSLTITFTEGIRRVVVDGKVVL